MEWTNIKPVFQRVNQFAELLYINILKVYVNVFCFLSTAISCFIEQNEFPLTHLNYKLDIIF